MQIANAKRNFRHEIAFLDQDRATDELVMPTRQNLPVYRHKMQYPQ